MKQYLTLKKDYEEKNRLFYLAKNKDLDLRLFGSCAFFVAILIVISNAYKLTSVETNPFFFFGLGIVSFIGYEYSKIKKAELIQLTQRQYKFANDSLILFLNSSDEIEIGACYQDEDDIHFKVLRIFAPNAIEVEFFPSGLTQIVSKEYVMIAANRNKDEYEKDEKSFFCYFKMPTRPLEDYEGRDLKLFSTEEIYKTIWECSQMDSDMMDGYNVHIFYQLETEFNRRREPFSK